MNTRATFANLTWLAASVPAHRRFTRALENPAEAQDEWLRDHLARNAATAYGREHGAHEIRTYDEFARRVPVVDYDQLEPWVARIRRGESSVLTRETVTRLLPTSGSSGARKLIPFTATLQRQFNAAIGPWLVDLCARDRRIALGPAYWSVTPMESAGEHAASVVPIGFEDDSRYLGGARAWLVEQALAVPSSVRHIGDLTAFRRTVLLHLLQRADLRLISVWHPSFLSLLLDALVRDWDSLLVELSAGKNPGRLRTLRRADPANVKTIWPELRIVSCWGDAHAAGPAGNLQQRLAGISIQPKGLLATEAFVTLPFAGRHPLAIRSHFFEFIDGHGRIHLAPALRAGEAYEVVVTTGGGLWRYRLGDRVEVTDFVGRTPSLRFLGRAGNVSDLCGEKLSDSFVTKVLAELCPAARFAMLAPESEGESRRYVLHVEGGELQALAERLDAALRRNPHYALCRELDQLAPLEVRRIERGGYESFAAAEMARGVRLGDIKPVALSPRTGWSRHFAERKLTSAVKPELNSFPS